MSQLVGLVHEAATGGGGAVGFLKVRVPLSMDRRFLWCISHRSGGLKVKLNITDYLYPRKPLCPPPPPPHLVYRWSD